jgi:outer membrane lipoprotein-sorting protein
MTRPNARLRRGIVLFFVLLGVASLPAQDILTANEFFANVAANYAAIDDYVAEMVWSDSSGVMRGSLLYKSPGMVRIDFTQPARQVFVSNGEVLQIYVPAFEVVLKQTLPDATAAPGALASTEGLALMRRNYSVAYLEGPEPVPLDEESALLVTKLRLDRRQVSEGFREIVLSIDSDGFIRRMQGTSAAWDTVTMDLNGIRINQGISDRVFEEDPAPTASVTEDFLIDPEG